MEECLPTDGDVELNVWVGFGTAWIELLVFLCRYRQQIPFGALVVIAQVDA